MVPLYDRLLLLGDFNINVCCPGKPLVSEFNNILNFCGFTQHIAGPTHVLGHTLDLIMSYGFPIESIEIKDASFSDHLPIVLNIFTHGPLSTVRSTGQYSRFINYTTVAKFSDSYQENAAESLILSTAQYCSNLEELLSLFYSFCLTILDSIAPLKLKRAQTTKSYPWLDDNSRILRRACRIAERRWKFEEL